MLAQNASRNQQFADNARQGLFGSYKDGGYSGGSLSKYMDPSSMNFKGLQGSYLSQYNNAANKVANNTQNAVGTTMQNLAQRGMGKTPAGFAADQERKAYADQAGTLGDLYSGTATAQHGEDVSNFWNANNMLNSNASQTANLSLQGNQAAAGNYANLYGTASQQVANPWAVAGQTLAGMGSAAGGVMSGMGSAKAGCWVAAELFGGWGDPRTILVRSWIFGPFQKQAVGRVLGKLYLRFGERVALEIKTNRPLRVVMQAIFNCALKAAKKGGGING